MLQLSIYRYNSSYPETKPYMQEYTIAKTAIKGNMILDALIAIQEQLDASLSFRKSCREGVCGSDGMNINGKNTLACIVPMSDFEEQRIVIKPLSGMRVIRDLIVDFDRFYQQYEAIEPYLKNDTPTPSTERLQSIKERSKLDGLYECILCGCCSSACPIHLKEQEKFAGPASMLQAARFILDSRDTDTQQRLEKLDEIHGLFKCQNILTCVDACPKGLDPNKAISEIRKKILE